MRLEEMRTFVTSVALLTQHHRIVMGVALDVKVHVLAVASRHDVMSGQLLRGAARDAAIFASLEVKVVAVPALTTGNEAEPRAKTSEAVRGRLNDHGQAPAHVPLYLFA
jgi:hypothetical protein